ncbi:MAG: Tetratricopeptide 2 repeat protein [Planctomycetota bacterium]|nr:Tetratricopeptide 2 repeat protein [Planctomycetota bacterium]
MVWIAFLSAYGCGGSHAPSPQTMPIAAKAKSSVAAVHALALLPPDGTVSGVSAIAWGGTSAPRRVGVRHTDGRFFVYQMEPGMASRRVGAPPETPPVRALAILGHHRAATGDLSGLCLWNTATDPARPIARVNCGPVSALAVTRGLSGQTDLFVGRTDGSVGRFRLVGEDRLERAFTEVASGSRSAVTRLGLLPDPSTVLATHDDGSTWTVRADGIGKARRSGSARDLAISADGQRLARLVDGPSIEVQPLDGKGPSRRFRLPSASSSLAFCGENPWVVVGSDRSLLMIPASVSGALRLDDVREETGHQGMVVVAVDPVSARLAVGDGSGRVEIIERDTIGRRGSPICLDETPEWAFRPELRFARPRPGARPNATPKIQTRLDSIWEKSRREGMAGLAVELGKMAEHPTLSPADLGEILAMEAAIEQAGGESSTRIIRKLEVARSAFSREGLTDREADMEFWRGLMLSRPFERVVGRDDRKSSAEAMAALTRAARLYRQCARSLERQAILCDAALAWVFLDRGDRRSAQRIFTGVEEAARIDTVLGHVVELDRVASALAYARGDWAGAEAIDGRLLQRLSDDERPSLQRETALGRASSLAALGRWAEAAVTLQRMAVTDPVGALRRAICRRSAGLPNEPPAGSSQKDLYAAQLDVLFSLRDPNRSPSAREAADLAVAVGGPRNGDREDLAIEAELARAEILESLGRHAEAASLHSSVVRKLRPLNGIDRLRRASRPILDASARALRGLARCEFAGTQPEKTLAAIEALSAMRPAEVHADGRTGISALGLSAAEFMQAEALREARAKLERQGTTSGGAEAEAAEVELRRLQSALAGHDRVFAIHDPTTAMDVSALKLAEGEAILVFAEVGPESMLGVIVKSTGVLSAKRLPMRRSELVRTVQSWRSALGDGGRPLSPRSPTTPGAILSLGAEPDLLLSATTKSSNGSHEARLHDALILPFQAELAGVTRLFLVPSPASAGMPIEILGRGSRLLEGRAVSYLPAASFLAAMRDDQRPDRPSDRRLLFVDPDGSPRSEPLLAVLRAPPWSAQLWRGSAARADRLKVDRLSSYAAIHLSSRAVFEAIASGSGEPELCLTAGASPSHDDGRLSAQELSEIPLRARVLVLSISDRHGTTGDGLLAMARAGLLTGSESVLLTLWEPPAESAQRFFLAFYASLASGTSAMTAFSDARAAVARDPKFRDPVHWAGYVLYGP